MNHVELVRKARGAEMPKSFWEDPLIYQGGSDDLLGAHDDARFVSEEHGIDLEAEVGSDHGRRADGDGCASRWASRIKLHRAGQRLDVAQPRAGRARQGLRLLSVEARDRLLAGGRHAR